MVVTRFAPSPTGYLHVGGARTALFCWLMARHHGGRMILRIEDTDQSRNTPTATAQVIRDLRWLGIEWDEGPDVGGPHAPYLQSERLESYNKYARKLLDEGKAYYCFDTQEELDAMRTEMEKHKKAFSYPRPTRFPTEAEAKAAKAAGRSVIVRFAMPGEDIIVHDILRGDVRFAAGEIGDFIIVKSDGFPTYHFACVVDDEMMEVTHVIRDQGHLMNTPGHQALQMALGFRTPVYSHMSVTVNESGGKMSKRDRAKALVLAIRTRANVDRAALAAAGGITSEQLDELMKGESMPDMPQIDAMAHHLGVHLPEINVVDFFRSGYLPEALFNFLALLGWNPGGDQEILPKEELIKAFNIEKLTKTNCLFDRRKLISFNTEYIKMLPAETLRKHLRDYLTEVRSPVAAADDALLDTLVKANEGARTLEDIDLKSRFLFVADDAVEFDEKAVHKVLQHNGGEGLGVLKLLRDKLDALSPFSGEAVEEMLRLFAEENKLGMGKVAQPIRVAICGTTISPPIFESVRLLGRQATLARIDRTLRKYGN
jgi:glutamyl/glutaminyl-tRNA synthetase